MKKTNKILRVMSFIFSLVLVILFSFIAKVAVVNYDYLIKVCTAKEEFSSLPFEFQNIMLYKTINNDERDVFGGMLKDNTLFEVTFGDDEASHVVDIGEDKFMSLYFRDGITKKILFRRLDRNILELDFDKWACAIGTQSEGQAIRYDLELDGKTDFVRNYIEGHGVFDADIYNLWRFEGAAFFFYESWRNELIRLYTDGNKQ